MLKLSGSEAVLAVVLAAIAAVVGYVLSEADRRKLGRTPWGLPSLVWALFWFLSWIIGLVLYLFAHRSEVRRAAQGQPPTFDAYGHYSPVPPPPPVSAADFPAYPRPADGSRRQASPVHAQPSPPPRPPAAAPPPVPLPPAVASPVTAGGSVVVPTPPSWQADPSGRFHYRWWTGTEWTSYVATDGQVTVDTSPDQRIGPY